MVRPSCVHKKQACVALYMPMVRDTCHLSGKLERELKSVAVDAGGSVNASGLFLSPASTAMSVTKATGVYRRSVLYFPRHMINADLLAMLDRGDYFILTHLYVP